MNGTKTASRKSMNRKTSWITGAAFAAALTLVGGPALAADKVLGLEMPSYSKKLEETRYQSPRNFEKTVKFFKDYFRGWRGVVWHREVNLPSVKYVHIENKNEKAKWSGVNIYEMPGGKVRIFVLERIAADAPAADAAKSDKKTSK
jgi:hypothetical protein